MLHSIGSKKKIVRWTGRFRNAAAGSGYREAAREEESTVWSFVPGMQIILLLGDLYASNSFKPIKKWHDVACSVSMSTDGGRVAHEDGGGSI